MTAGIITPITTHAQDARNRLATQYANRPWFSGVLDALVGNPIQAVEDVAVSIPTTRALANAYGEQLDLYGELVDLPRNGTGDDTYRRLIAGAIGEQNSDGTLPTLIGILSGVFATSGVFVTDTSSPGSFSDPVGTHTSVAFGLGLPQLDPGQWNLAIASFLRSVPAAVNVYGLWTFNTQRAFSMAGPQAWASLGFGDASNPNVGGGFGALIFEQGDVGGISDATSATGGSASPVGSNTGIVTTPTPGGSTAPATGSSTTPTTQTGSTSTGTTTPTPTTETYSVIYQNGVQNQWTDYSYESADYGYDTDTRIAGGIARAATGGLKPYKAFNFGNLNGASLPIANYLGVMCDMKVASGTAHVRFQLDAGDNGSPAIYKEFDVTPQWTTYKYYFSDSGVVNNSGSSFTNVEICNFVYPNVTFPQVDINNLQMIINPSPTVPTYHLVAPDPSPAAATSGWLHTKGNKFYDANNNVWIGRGFNTCDTRMAGKAREQDGAVPTNTATFLCQRLGWAIAQGVTFFRLYLDMESAALSIENNANYLQSIKQVVDYIGQQGAHVMISMGVDYTCYPYPPNSGSGQPTVLTLTQWSQVAASFINSGHVLFGLCNEPQGNSTDASVAAYMGIVNQCIQVIRTVEARDGAPNPHIIVVQGPTNYARNGKFFNTTRATDTFFPITDLVNSVGYLAYEVHCYEKPSAWPAVPYNDGLPLDSVNFPYILGEFGFDYYAVSDGSASYNPPTVDDTSAFINACEQNSVPYCAWILDTRDYPTLLIDNDPTGDGAGKPIQWNPTGLRLMNLIRQARGLTGSVDLNGNVTS